MTDQSPIDRVAQAEVAHVHDQRARIKARLRSYGMTAPSDDDVDRVLALATTKAGTVDNRHA